MTGAPSPATADLTPGRPIVFRGATVLTMDDAHHILRGADVLITGDRITAVGPGLQVPEGTAEIDATGGIVMPGMIDTHRHMWQTAMRGYGADWTLTQYFVWNYLQWGKSFRPADIYAGNLLSAIEAIDAGVTTTVDWSHGLQTTEHADAAVDALEEVPGRFVLAYGNIQQGPWQWSAAPEFRDFVNRRFTSGNDMLGLQMAFDITGGDEFPERAAFEVARELGLPVTTRATLSADRAREHLEAHARGETVTNHKLRAEQVVSWATRGGAHALDLDGVIGSLEPGKKADVVLIKNDDSPVMAPVLHPYGHVVFQAQRADVHTVVVNGRVVKYGHRLVGTDLAKARQAVEQTVEHLLGELGPEAWIEGMHPEIPETRVLHNPYTYTYTEGAPGARPGS